MRLPGLLLIGLCCLTGCSTPPKPAVVILDGNRALLPGMKNCEPAPAGKYLCEPDADRDQITKGYLSSIIAELGRCGL